MTLHLTKGEVQTRGRGYPRDRGSASIEVDKDEMVKSHLWIAKAFDSLAVPAGCT